MKKAISTLIILIFIGTGLFLYFNKHQVKQTIQTTNNNTTSTDYWKMFSTIWSEYRENPNEMYVQKILDLLPDTFKDCVPDSEYTNLAIDSTKNYDFLKKQVLKDTPKIFEVINKLRNISCGINAEELATFSGYYIEVNPNNFLKVIQTTAEAKIDWVNPTDDVAVDNIPLQKKQIIAKIDSLKTVTDNNLISIRNMWITALQSDLESLIKQKTNVAVYKNLIFKFPNDWQVTAKPKENEFVDKYNIHTNRFDISFNILQCENANVQGCFGSALSVGNPPNNGNEKVELYYPAWSDYESRFGLEIKNTGELLDISFEIPDGASTEDIKWLKDQHDLFNQIILSVKIIDNFNDISFIKESLLRNFEALKNTEDDTYVDLYIGQIAKFYNQYESQVITGKTKKDPKMDAISNYMLDKYGPCWGIPKDGQCKE